MRIAKIERGITFDYYEKFVKDEPFLKTAKNYLDIAEELITLNKIDKKNFYISQVLEEYDADMQKKYCKFLFNFVNVIEEKREVYIEKTGTINDIDFQEKALDVQGLELQKHISEDFFDNVNNITNELITIFRKLENDDEFHKTIKEKNYSWKINSSILDMSYHIHADTIATSGLPKGTKSTITEKIRALFLSDLPVETVVHENQQGYYDALAISQKLGNSKSFIEFMLNAILQALEELPIRKITDIFTDINTDKFSKAELEFLEQIAGYLDKNGEINNYRAQLLTNKSDISVKKYFAKFVELGLLEIEGRNKGRKYKIKKQ